MSTTQKFDGQKAYEELHEGESMEIECFATYEQPDEDADELEHEKWFRDCAENAYETINGLYVEEQKKVTALQDEVEKLRDEVKGLKEKLASCEKGHSISADAGVNDLREDTPMRDTLKPATSEK